MAARVATDVPGDGTSRRYVLALLGVLAMLGTSTESSAQAPGNRVRVHLLGLRVVEDTVVRWSEDSLFLWVPISHLVP